MRPRRWGLALAVAAALTLAAARVGSTLYVDYRWFDAMGASSVWRDRTLFGLALRGTTVVLGTLFALGNLLAVRRSVAALVLPRRVGNLEFGEQVRGAYLTWAAAAAAVLLGALLAVPGADWTNAVLAFTGQPFGERDPYFQLDLGFWVYWLPLERSMYWWALLSLVANTVLVTMLYVFTGALTWSRRAFRVSGYVRRHLGVLGSLFLVLLAWSYRLDAYELLVNGSGLAGAFSSVDHEIRIPVNLVLAVIALTAAAPVLWAGWSGQPRLALAAVSVVLVASLGLRQILPALHGSPDDDASELTLREAPYLATRELFSRRAYAVDAISRRPGVDSARLTVADAARSVTAWDDAPLARAIERHRRGGPITDRIGWMATADGLRAVLVERDGPGTKAAPRSVLIVAPDAAPPAGVPMVVDSVDAGGRLTTGAALVYPGASGYVMVDAVEGAVPGPELRSLASRLGHALSSQDLRLYAGATDARATRIVRIRDVRERIAALAPFLSQGDAPVPVVAAESLYWMLDLYSSSSDYPLSHHLLVHDTERAYLQHVATAVVHAGTGRVALVPVENARLDPIARTWRHRYAALFSSWSELPAELAARAPPPSDAAQARASIFARYGSASVRPLRGRSARGDAADTLFAGGGPSHAIVGGGAGLSIITPVLDRAEQVRGVLVTAGGPRGLTTWIPLAEPAVAWARIRERLQRSFDSVALPGRDARLALGTVRAVPLENEIAWLQPGFSYRPNAPPVLIRAAIVSGDSVHTGPTLAMALGAPVAPVRASPADARASAAAEYARMRDAARRGDWRAFGEAFDRLGTLLAAPTP